MTGHNIFRFKFCNIIIELIHDFSKIHEYDDNKTYKEKWVQFLEINNELIEREQLRLNDLGYTKNINDKMYRSGRYYFRKKTNDDTKKNKQRRKYISCDIIFIDLMDKHISENINNNIIKFKPSTEYLNFQDIYKNEIKLELERIHMIMEIDNNELIHKIKKTYKNRYYLISHTTPVL
jgi:hypothetical protein